MTCERLAEILDAYVDGEVDPLLAREVEWHLGECPECARHVAARRSLGEALRTHLPRYRAPADLLPDYAPASRSLRFWRGTSAALAACLALAIGASLWLAVRPGGAGAGGDAMVAQWVLNNHLRSLQLGMAGTAAAGTGEGHLVDVESSDRHTVKPWFAGKISFAPPVRDLKEEGFPLIGGRLEMVDGREAAALVYRRQKHIINLLIWPVEQARERAPELETAAPRGYHEVHWTHAGLTFWAVSDVEEGELLTFARTFSAEPAATAP